MGLNRRLERRLERSFYPSADDPLGQAACTAMRLMGYDPDFIAEHTGGTRVKVGEANYGHNRPSRGPQRALRRGG
jgi:hypothetical protein